MNLYLLSQTDREGYDTFDSINVAAPNVRTARTILPRPSYTWEDCIHSWAATPQSVVVELIGTAVEGTQQGVILASFNAG